MFKTINLRHEIALAEAQTRTPMKALLRDYGSRVDYIPDLKSSDMLRFCGLHWEREIAQGSEFWAQMVVDFGHHGLVSKHPR